MRKILIALGVLYLLVMGQLAGKYWRAYQLSLDAQLITGKVMDCEQNPVDQDPVVARYEFEVGGRRYSNSFETTPLPVGSQIDLYYSPSHPDLNSSDSPDFSTGRVRKDAISETVGFAFWAALLSGLAWLRRR